MIPFAHPGGVRNLYRHRVDELPKSLVSHDKEESNIENTNARKSPQDGFPVPPVIDEHDDEYSGIKFQLDRKGEQNVRQKAVPAVVMKNINGGQAEKERKDVVLSALQLE